MENIVVINFKLIIKFDKTNNDETYIIFLLIMSFSEGISPIYYVEAYEALFL